MSVSGWENSSTDLGNQLAIPVFQLTQDPPPRVTPIFTGHQQYAGDLPNPPCFIPQIERWRGAY